MKDLSFTSVTYLFIFFFLSPWISEPANGRLVLWICYEQLCVWCNFIILLLDFLPHPPIFGEIGKLPQILPKNDGALIWQVVVTKRLNI